MPGFIVYDPYTQSAQGVGATLEAAMADARVTVAMCGVRLLDREDEADGLARDEWVMASDYSVLPATDALCAAGPGHHWEEVDGIACTPAEAATALLVAETRRARIASLRCSDRTSLDSLGGKFHEGLEGRFNEDKEILDQRRKLSDIDEFFGYLNRRPSRTFAEENDQLEIIWMKYHEGHYEKSNRKLVFPDLEIKYTIVDPVHVLRTALHKAPNPTEWARSHGISPSYLRQVLNRSRGIGDKLLTELKIDRFIMYKMSSEDAKHAGARKAPKVAGYAVTSCKTVWSAGVNEASAWIEILASEDPRKKGTSRFDALTCRPCSQGLLDRVRSCGATGSYAEVKGVLCLKDEVNVT